jgi:methionine-gamma-lyase
MDDPIRRAPAHSLAPETLMMSYGYEPRLSEGAVKPPIFLTSTFVFETAQQGKDFFDYAAGRRSAPDGHSPGLVYSRFNNPNLEILEDRLRIWDHADAAAVFSSGMSAIATTLFAHLRAGDAMLYVQPIYGGTETLAARTLPSYGIATEPCSDGLDETALRVAAARAQSRGRLAAIVAETPANPTNDLVDIAILRRIADDIGRETGLTPVVIIDNTFLGPMYQRPLDFGADLIIYSLTKYAGGHSDLIAGAALGTATAMGPVRALRSTLGTQLDPHSAWMLLRSLETFALRVEKASRNAERIAEFLRDQPKVHHVQYLDFLPADSKARAVFERQCAAAGSTMSFHVQGGEADAFRFLDALQLIKLAVSLGGTESLVCHPASTTHSGVPREVRERLGMGDDMIRLAVGIEHPDDLIADLRRGLAAL